ncbi:hypothetical protein, partial [Chitinilyticum litopenaei]|uniref:hypothetical protein n=1 Tax=Chitinilyticum litopenaei TaxID=1121276 RepID=UPI001B7FBC32
RTCSVIISPGFSSHYLFSSVCSVHLAHGFVVVHNRADFERTVLLRGLLPLCILGCLHYLSVTLSGAFRWRFAYSA